MYKWFIVVRGFRISPVDHSAASSDTAAVLQLSPSGRLQPSKVGTVKVFVFATETQRNTNGCDRVLFVESKICFVTRCTSSFQQEVLLWNPALWDFYGCCLVSLVKISSVSHHFLLASPLSNPDWRLYCCRLLHFDPPLLHANLWLHSVHIPHMTNNCLRTF